MRSQLTLLSLLLLIATAACQPQPVAHNQPATAPDASQPKLRDYMPSAPLVAQPFPVGQGATPFPVAEGSTPLVYLLEGRASVRVMDTTSNVQVAEAVAGPRALIRIDDQHGVIFGQENIRPGPLPDGHRYAIYVETGKVK